MADERRFIKNLAQCDSSFTVPMLKAASRKHWETIRGLCHDVAEGKITNVKLPRASKRWFGGVVNNRHSSIENLKRSTLQRGGSKAELFGSAIKAIAKAAAPHLKKAGSSLAKQAASAAISSGAEALRKKANRKKGPTSSSSTQSSSKIKLSSEEEEELKDLF